MKMNDAGGMSKAITEFHLNGTEYIELKNLLKVSGLCENGAEAKAAIGDGQVTVDGQLETRKACKIRNGQTVVYKGLAVKVL